MIADRYIISSAMKKKKTLKTWRPPVCVVSELACTIVIAMKYHTVATNLKRIITVELCVSAVYRINFCKRLL